MKTKQIDPEEYSRIAWAADEVGVARTTLDSAVRSGYVNTVTFRDGSVMVEATRVAEWHAKDKRRGPKPKPAET